ncbi:transcriptional repressor NrdR [Puniceicoccales bacterium CK1056]|uniref:Transcriptional repressor NrdR n=1 Tax=Oceanipulchritudo coccoides TaxID=2706888 RepID=A0A6B2LZV8_9BACT|nr:transcriptional regulator NrdR [Oceanipulchritudo coccoides]NDV61050.1 transcriptional repressor NrdR [Oceanipulchritudo coccoides]
MQCPKCGTKDTRVIDSRVSSSGLAIRRRRSCQNCGYRFSTTEEIVTEDLYVIKNDGRREPFDRNKVAAGVRRATEKRPVDGEQIEMLIADVLADLEVEFDSEIPARAIGERIMTRLKGIDQIAYVRFASVYKQFRDIDELAKEIDGLQKQS